VKNITIIVKLILEDCEIFLSFFVEIIKAKIRLAESLSGTDFIQINY